MNNSGKHPIAKNPVTYAFMLIMALLLLASTAGFAQKRSQTIRDTTAILRDQTKTVEEKLVELALLSPQYKRTDAQNKVNEYQLKKAQKSWLNLLQVSGMYNFSNALNKTDNTNNVYVPPGLNLGLTIPFGVIFSKGTDVKIQREALRLSQLNQEVMARDLKSEVLSKYLQYKTYNDLIILQNRVVDDEEAVVLQLQKKYREAGVAVEVLNAANKSLNIEKTKKLNYQLYQDQIKLEIEEIIWVPLESVLQGNK